jgi:hypothetical protein
MSQKEQLIFTEKTLETSLGLIKKETLEQVF